MCIQWVQVPAPNRSQEIKRKEDEEKAERRRRHREKRELEKAEARKSIGEIVVERKANLLKAIRNLKMKKQENYS